MKRKPQKNIHIHCTLYIWKKKMYGWLCAACIFNDKMKRKQWNVCRRFSAFFFHSCAAFQLNILTSLTFPAEIVVAVVERYFPISFPVLCTHSVVVVVQYICFFLNLHSFVLLVVHFHVLDLCFFSLSACNTLSAHKHFKCGHYELPLQISFRFFFFWFFSHALLIKLRIYFCLHSILNVLQCAHSVYTDKVNKSDGFAISSQVQFLFTSARTHTHTFHTHTH